MRAGAALPGGRLLLSTASTVMASNGGLWGGCATPPRLAPTALGKPMPMVLEVWEGVLVGRSSLPAS